MPPEELGRAGHEFATQIDPVHLWAVPNFTLIGRKVLAGRGMHRPGPMWSTSSRPVVDFWERAARAYRFDDGTHQAWDADGLATPYRDHVDDDRRRVPRRCGDDERARHVAPQRAAHVVPLLAVVRHALRLPGHRARTRSPTAACCCCASFNRLGVSHFPWSAEVVDGHAVHRRARRVRARRRRPARHRLRHVGDAARRTTSRTSSSSASSTSRRAMLRPIDDAGADALAAAAKQAQRAAVPEDRGDGTARQDRRGRVRVLHVPASVRRVAGVELDWTVPRDSLDLYPFLELIEGGVEPMEQEPSTYYPPHPVTARPADEAPHAPESQPGWSDAWQLDAANADGVGLSLRLDCYPNEKVAWFWTYLVAARSRRARSSCATTRCRCRARASRSAPKGCGPSCGARRRSSTGRTGSKRSASRSTTPTTRSRGEIGERIPSVSTSNGRPTGRSTVRRTTGRSTSTRRPASSTVTCCSGANASSSMRAATTPAAGAYGGGRTPEPGPSRVTARTSPSSGGIARRSRRRMDPAPRWRRRADHARRDVKPATRALRFVFDDDVEVQAEVLTGAPVPIAETTVLDRALCRFRRVATT